MANMGRLDWGHHADHIRSRSGRRPGDVDIEPSWADEAWVDEHALFYDPDPTSKSGESVRLVGYSPSASGVLVVIAIRESGRWVGLTAWKANRSYQRRYWEGQ